MCLQWARQDLAARDLKPTEACETGTRKLEEVGADVRHMSIASSIFLRMRASGANVGHRTLLLDTACYGFPHSLWRRQQVVGRADFDGLSSGVPVARR